MIYDGLYGKEKECWGCGGRTRNAIIKHGNKDENIPVCGKCILKLHKDIAGLLYCEHRNGKIEI